MDKFTQELEKHVQWVVLALAAAWLGYIIYGYAMNTPIVFDAEKGKKLHAGEVDPYIKDKWADILDEKMRSTKKPTLATRPVAQQFMDRMRNDGVQMPALAANWIESGDVSKFSPLGNGQVNNSIVMQDIPDVVAPKIVEVKQMLAVVKLPPPAAGAPVAPVGGGQKGQVPGQQDRNVIQMMATFSISDQQANFGKVLVPPQFQVPRYLQVQVIREELLPEGQWGNPTPILPPSINNALLALPATFEQQEIYRQWAVAHQENILKPKYFDLIAVQTVMATEPAPVPQPKPVPVPPRPKTPPPAPKLPPRSDLGLSDGRVFAQVVAPEPPPKPNIFDGPAPANPNPRNPRPVSQPLQWTQTIHKRPRSRFEEKFHFYDDSVYEGRTYRYKVRILVVNPVFNTANTAKNPAWTKIFYLPQPTDAQRKDQGWSDFCDPIAIPSKTKFFVNRTPFQGRGITLEIFQWSGGQNRREEVEVTPGDTIGTTGWTVVDVKEVKQNSDWLVLLINEEGTRMLRSYRADMHDAERQRLKGGKAAIPGQPAAGVAAPPAVAQKP